MEMEQKVTKETETNEKTAKRDLSEAVGCAWEPGRKLHEIITGADDLWSETWPENKAAWAEDELAILTAFTGEVNRRAEAKMLTTGKLEGAHHASIKEVLQLYLHNGKADPLHGRGKTQPEKQDAES